MMTNYLKVLEESQQKKLDVLVRMEELCLRQEQLLKTRPMPEEEFDQSITEKGVLIEELTRLDEGFETLFQNLKEQLVSEKEKYKHQIGVLQVLITKVTEKSMSVQAQEARNKTLLQEYFEAAERELQKGRLSSKAALDYYRSMNQSRIVPPQFMDQKK